MLRRGPRSRGQSVAEFAIILPVFLLITLGVVDMARVFIAYVSLENGVREAAIFAAGSSNGHNSDKWCTTVGGKLPTPAVSVPCPTGTVVGTNDKSADPNNIAYRIDAEASDMDASHIVLSAPTTTIDANCDSSTAGDGKRVTITAQYSFKLLMPVVSTMFSGGIPMTATTSTCVL